MHLILLLLSDLELETLIYISSMITLFLFVNAVANLIQLVVDFYKLLMYIEDAIVQLLRLIFVMT